MSALLSRCVFVALDWGGSNHEGSIKKKALEGLRRRHGRRARRQDQAVWSQAGRDASTRTDRDQASRGAGVTEENPPPFVALRRYRSGPGSEAHQAEAAQPLPRGF